ncbi:MAG TPA: hypothetical protein VG269_10760 [Tepidisphaeraceae bacterium]|jgi:hypothetical protein|nr:hypothetical protein [Tepidisphaeraceae bacterium]
MVTFLNPKCRLRFNGPANASGLRVREEAEQEISERGGEEGAADDVEDAAEAGDDLAAFFDLGIAFHHAFEQVPGLSHAAEDYTQYEAFPSGCRKRDASNIDGSGRFAKKKLVCGEYWIRPGLSVLISFTDAYKWMRHPRPGDALPELLVNPCRPNRAEPRCKKRRPKQYDLMNEPQGQLRKQPKKQRKKA